MKTNYVIVAIVLIVLTGGIAAYFLAKKPIPITAQATTNDTVGALSGLAVLIGSLFGASAPTTVSTSNGYFDNWDFLGGGDSNTTGDSSSLYAGDSDGSNDNQLT